MGGGGHERGVCWGLHWGLCNWGGGGGPRTATGGEGRGLEGWYSSRGREDVG